MKKIYKVLVVMVAVLLAAAPAEAKIFRFGVRAGLNVSDMSLDNTLEKAIDPDNNCGWNAGVMAEVTVPIIGICADVSVMYSRLNQKVKADKNGIQGVELDEQTKAEFQDAPNNFGQNFLEIPVHLKYKLSLPAVGNVVAPFVLTGPSFAFNLNKKTFDDIKNRKCQTSWDFGIGVELFNHLQIQGAYCMGMNNLAKYWDFGGLVDKDTSIKIKNNYWNISAAWLF